MTEQHVSLVREGIEAFNRRDADALLATLHPEAEMMPLRAVLEGGAYRGHEGLRRFLEDVGDDWEEFRLEPVEFLEPGPDRVLVLGRVIARGRASGVEVDSVGAWLCHLREGKVVRVRFYTDREAAMEEDG